MLCLASNSSDVLRVSQGVLRESGDEPLCRACAQLKAEALSRADTALEKARSPAHACHWRMATQPSHSHHISASARRDTTAGDRPPRLPRPGGEPRGRRDRAARAGVLAHGAPGGGDGAAGVPEGAGAAQHGRRPDDTSEVCRFLVPTHTKSRSKSVADSRVLRPFLPHSRCCGSRRSSLSATTRRTRKRTQAAPLLPDAAVRATLPRRTRTRRRHPTPAGRCSRRTRRRGCGR